VEEMKITNLEKEEIKIGCCGFPVGKERYYKELDVVELQSTFYQPPKLAVIEQWRKEAPENFEFTLKAWQVITHPATSPTYRRSKIKIQDSKLENYGFFKPTDEVFSAWEETERVAQILNAKIIVFQSPASFKPTQENKKNLEGFFKRIKRKDYLFAWEPRGNWKSEEIERLCKDLNFIHCVDPFKNEPLYGQMRYLRLHGIGGYSYKYTKGDLDVLKTRYLGNIPTYFMFNNVFMFENAVQFKNLSLAHRKD